MVLRRANYRGASPPLPSSRRLAAANQLLKLRVIAQNQEVRVLLDPFQVSVAALDRFLESIEGFLFLFQNPIGARGIVENVGVIRAQGNGHLQVALGFFNLAGFGEQTGHEDARADILGDLL
jgi:hypothetical protein